MNYSVYIKTQILIENAPDETYAIRRAFEELAMIARESGAIYVT